MRQKNNIMRQRARARHKTSSPLRVYSEKNSHVRGSIYPCFYPYVKRGHFGTFRDISSALASGFAGFPKRVNKNLQSKSQCNRIELIYSVHDWGVNKEVI
jgi:hypothetical protein